MKRTAVLLLSLIIIPLILIYMFYPLDSDVFKIRIDEKNSRMKEQYLARDRGINGSGEHPNILWILVDDLGMADSDLYENGPVSTPQIRKLASEGVKFTNAYISSPVCSPSRAAIATGRYNQRFGFEHQMHERYLKNRLEYYAFRYLIDSYPWIPKYQTEVPDANFVSSMGLPESEITLAEVAGKHGYKSGFIGKWHLGKQNNKSPNNFGFDHFYGFYSSHSLYIPENTMGFVDQKIPEDFSDKYIWEGQRKGLQAIRVNGKIVEEDRYLTKAITDESIEFIRNNKDGPFYLWTSYNAPHTPLQAPESYVKIFASEPDPVKRVHYAMIKCLDDEIGRLLDYLDSENLSENTLVFFLSDNGGAEYNLTTDNGSYQGGKITNFEGGVKVPMIMKWPEVVSEGIEFNMPVHATDLFTTSVFAVGAELPGDRIYDGANLAAHINKNSVPHRYIYHEMGTNRGIRDLQYKLAWNEVNGDTVLFDLIKDPFEQINIYGSLPEVAKNLSFEFNKWSSQNTSPLWPSMIHYHYLADDGKEYFFDE